MLTDSEIETGGKDKVIRTPISICHERYYVQKSEKYWLLYKGDADGNGDLVQKFKSLDELIIFVNSIREKKRRMKYGDN